MILNADTCLYTSLYKVWNFSERIHIKLVFMVSCEDRNWVAEKQRLKEGCYGQGQGKFSLPYIVLWHVGLMHGNNQ